MIQRKNFSGIPVGQIPKDSEYRNCNFSQPAPDMSGADPVGIRLFPGDATPRTFIDCNLLNCEPPPGSTVVRCNTAIVERNVLIDTDEVIVDNVTVALTEQRGSKVYGRFNGDTGQYEYKTVPEVIND